MESFNQNYYEILGRIPRYSTPEEIKKAYRTLAKHYHPDKHDDKGYAKEMMQKLNEAYEILSNPEKRAEYDESLDSFMKQKEQEEKLRRQKEKEELFRTSQQSQPPQEQSESGSGIGVVGFALGMLALGLLLDSIFSKKNEQIKISNRFTLKSN